MKTSEYVAHETAEMVGKDLMHLLGMTNKQVASTFCHAVYDGVYATKEERVRERGSLSQ